MIIRFLALLCLAIMLSPVLAGPRGGGPVAVHGYVKSNGTYVAPHYRSAPDGIMSNNWSTVGNVNPYTGEPGKKNPYPTGAIAASASHERAASVIAMQRGEYYNPEEEPEDTRRTDADTQSKKRSHPLASTSLKKPHISASRVLSADESVSLEMACILAKSDGPATYNACKKTQVAALAAGVPHPNLSSLNAEERQSIDMACILAKSDGPAAMNKCLTSQLVQFTRTPRSPALNSLTPSERQSIDMACILAKSDGPAVMHNCLTSQLAAFARTPKAPDLSRLGSSERQSIDMACILAKSDGPAALSKCLNSQLAAYVKGPKSPNLARLSYSDRQSIDMACIVAKSDGPARYNKCLNEQVRAMGAPTSRQ